MFPVLPADAQEGSYQSVPITIPADFAHPVEVARDPKRNEFTVIEKYGRIRVFDWQPDQVPAVRCEPDNRSAVPRVLSGITYSQDGRDLYIGEHRSGEILWFRRSEDDNCWQRQDNDPVDLPVIPGVHSLLMGWYGQELIATSSTGQQIGIFNRAANGRLSASCFIRHPDFMELGAIAGRNNHSELLVADILHNTLFFLNRPDNHWQLSGQFIDLANTDKGSFQGPASMAFFGNQLYIAASKSDALLVYQEQNKQWQLLQVLQDYVPWQGKQVSLKAPVKLLVSSNRQELTLVTEDALLLFDITLGQPLQLADVLDQQQDKLVSAAALYQPYRLVSISQFSEVRALQWQTPEPTVSTGGAEPGTMATPMVFLLLPLLVLLSS